MSPANDLLAACRQTDADLAVLERLISEPATDPLAWIATARDRLRSAIAAAEAVNV